MDINRPWYVYMLLCDNSVFYIGITYDLVKRMSEHRGKKSKYTSRFNKITVVYIEKHDNARLAAKRERQLKTWTRAKKQLLVEGKLGYNKCTELVEELRLNG